MASHTDIISELCVSDNPDYTTGYVASKSLGYVRIPHIKDRSSMYGGRVFFVKDSVDLNLLKRYLEERPVIINIISRCKGQMKLDEIMKHSYHGVGTTKNEKSGSGYS